MSILNKLNHSKVKNTSDSGLYSDGGGLYLQISKAGTKSWIYRFSLNKKRREMGLGSFPEIGLSEARELATDARKLSKQGIDPIEERKASRAALAEQAKSLKTFKDCATKYLSKHEVGWKNAKHIQQWKNTLSSYVYPVFGSTPVSEINTEAVQKVLSPIWNTKTETATRIRSRIERILDWARVKGYRKGENPARWRGNLEHLYARPSKLKNVRRMPSLPHDQIALFISNLHNKRSITARAVELMILTATRTNETIAATWDEIDLKNKTWTIPKERMKGGVEHVIPLSDRSIDLFKNLPKPHSGYIFPSSHKGKHISSASMLKLIKNIGANIGHPDITSHGFRASFKTWCSETQDFDRQAVEFCLAHQIKDKTEEAYHRSNLIDKRSIIINKWSDYINTCEAIVK